MKKLANIKSHFAFLSHPFQAEEFRRIILLVILLLTGMVSTAQVGVHTDFPDNSSAMEIYATDRGLLIPRVTLTNDVSDPGPVTNPAVGLLVFNSGANQPLGFYYWDGAQWVTVGSGGGTSGDFWNLYGNSGTQVGTNFIGTTDDEDFAIFTNNIHRLRVEADGQVVIAGNGANYAEDLFSVEGNAVQNSTINAYSPHTGVYTESSSRGYQSLGGRYGLVATLDSAGGFGVYAKNSDPNGYGMITSGANSPAYSLNSRTCGIASSGASGVFGFANSSTGTGVIAIGSAGDTAYMNPSGSGGAFTGYHGTISRARNVLGTGVVGGGNNASSLTMAAGSGGAFTGTSAGAVGWGTNSTNSTGVIGVGNNGSITALNEGTGGAFTGYHGIISKGSNASGIGVIAIGNNGGSWTTITAGGGGSFTGNHGLVGAGLNTTSGTGVIGAGNGASYQLFGSGSGGAFTGTSVGTVAWATGASGVGVVGAGNNETPVMPGGGGGGSFTGTIGGVYGYATTSANGTFGGYFQNGGATSYAYVGYRVSNQNRKISGNGSVTTIVKNTKGELIALTCPEAPETVFQDFGTGQLVDGRAYISIDPDLAININVSEEHPLKVYITPEGDCNGVYVTNKSAQGFDVIELQGGTSDVPFAWQIVATRANEEVVLKDGSVEKSDYSQRFPPAPGPLEIAGQPGQTLHRTATGMVEHPETIKEKPVTATLKQESDPVEDRRKTKRDE